jgi:hypothetical protein
MDGGVILGLLVAPLALWAALIVVLARPAAQRPAYGARAVPDLVRLVRGLLRESSSAPGRGRYRVSNDRSRIGMRLDFAS